MWIWWRVPVLALLVAPSASLPIAAAQDKPALTPAEYGRWEAMNPQPQPLSPDGRWLVYGVTRSDGRRELRLTDLQSSAETQASALRTPKTTPRPFGERPAFSADSQWLADLVGMSEADEAALKKEKKPVQKKLRITKLATGDTKTIDAIEEFAFSATGTHLAMRRAVPKPDTPAEPKDSGDDTPIGSTLIIRTLATGVDLSIGSVSQFAWQTKGPLLAAAITAEGGAGNGVQLFDGVTGQLRVLDSSSSIYSGLAWRKDAHDLAVLRSVTMESRDGASQTVVAWTGLSRGGDRVEYAPAADQTFPSGMRIVAARPPAWSEDGAIVFVGLADWRDKPARDESSDKAANDDDLPGVDVWHPRDAIVMPKQKIDATADRKKNMLAAWRLKERRLVRLARSTDEIVRPLGRQERALVIDAAPYAMERSIGRPAADVATVDLRTGERTAVKTGIDDSLLQTSPGGRYALFLLDDHYWTVDLTSGAEVNITKLIATAFVDRDSDATVKQKPPFGVAGWTTGDESVLLYDQFDIWEIRPEGTRPIKLTAGAAEQVRHRYLKLDADETAIDRTRPLYLALFGTLSKKSGFARLRLDGSAPAVDRLVWLDNRVDRLAKAKDTEAYAYIAQSFTDSPDYFVIHGTPEGVPSRVGEGVPSGTGAAGETELKAARQVSTTNPFMSDYAWGRAELIEYRNERGARLQGALRYPVNYQAGRKYPMVVYMYEKRSDLLHTFSTPSEREYYNVAAFTQHGYFVLEPDIRFRPREPGLSVVECVVPAVKQVVKMGVVDPGKVGIVGHSWGGFDTVYLATHTTTFAAAVAGAPITDLISNYGNHHWSSGIAETDHIETGQQRMEVPLWEDLQAYIRNSAVFAVHTMKTPLLLETGDDDGTVHWHQSVELYNVARRAGKHVVMLVYNGEDHGLRKRPNQMDYQRRIFEWFDHYLKGDAPKDWITKGTSHLQRERDLKRATRVTTTAP